MFINGLSGGINLLALLSDDNDKMAFPRSPLVYIQVADKLGPDYQSH